MSQQGFFTRLAAILGGLGVVLGAFGAHGLKNWVAPELLSVFEIGVRYQMYHAIAMLAVAVAAPGLWRSSWTARGCWAWVVGIVVFSGSLYLLTVTGMRWFGAITPIGGVAFIVGWGMVALAARELRGGGQEN